MNIGFATADWSQSYLTSDGLMTPGGSGWYRMVMIAREFQRNGVNVVIGTAAFNKKDEVMAVRQPYPSHDSSDEARARRLMDGRPESDPATIFGGFDVVVLQRWMRDGMPEAIERAKANGQVIVNDVDDWFFGLDPRNQAFTSSHPKVNPLENVNHYRRALAASSCVTVSTPFLAERLRSMGVPRVEVLPNMIDLARWNPPERHPGRLNYGWVGAMPWRSGDLETVSGVVGPLLTRDLHSQSAMLHHSGVHPNDRATLADLWGVPDDRFSWSRMQPIDRYPKLFDPIDVGLVPLRDAPFNEAKSAIKGMEYAASGLPFVAQPTRSYRALEDVGVGVTVEKPKEWRWHLKRLADPEERLLEGKQNREGVGRFDVADRWRDWFDCYCSLIA